eukprot:TRINITY_DN5460_c0_g2_i1.p1 TRINITY_DN5460_c0_g2~~TRINITY_DN5460_c0_g2_i1.p1  ORF type:complete len:684 (-),score=119.54 TRINITY_DN5460_c0_g2_i1:209-2260(-)
MPPRLESAFPGALSRHVPRSGDASPCGRPAAAEWCRAPVAAACLSRPDEHALTRVCLSPPGFRRGQGARAAGGCRFRRRWRASPVWQLPRFCRRPRAVDVFPTAAFPLPHPDRPVVMASSGDAATDGSLVHRISASTTKRLTTMWSPLTGPSKVHDGHTSPPDAPFLATMSSAVSPPLSPQVSTSRPSVRHDNVHLTDDDADASAQACMTRISSSSHRTLTLQRQRMYSSGDDAADLDESDDDGEHEMDPGHRQLRFLRASSLLEGALGRRSPAMATTPTVPATAELYALGGAAQATKSDEAAGPAKGAPVAAHVAAKVALQGPDNLSVTSEEARDVEQVSGRSSFIGDPMHRPSRGDLNRRLTRLGPRTQKVFSLLHLTGRKAHASDVEREAADEQSPSTALVPTSAATTSKPGAAAPPVPLDEVGQALLLKGSGGRTSVLLTTAASALRRVHSRRHRDGGDEPADGPVGKPRVAPPLDEVDGLGRIGSLCHSPRHSTLVGSSGALSLGGDTVGALSAPSRASASETQLRFNEDAKLRPGAARRACSRRSSRFELLSANASPRYSYSWSDTQDQEDAPDNAPYVRRRASASAVGASASTPSSTSVARDLGRSTPAASMGVRDAAVVEFSTPLTAGGSSQSVARAPLAGASGCAVEGSNKAVAVVGDGGSVSSRLKMWEARSE